MHKICKYCRRDGKFVPRVRLVLCNQHETQGNRRYWADEVALPDPVSGAVCEEQLLA